MGHARALLGLADPHRQRELCARISRKGYSVREVERQVREQQGRATPEPTKKIPRQAPAWLMEMETRLRGQLGTKVQVQNGEGYQGEIVIEYHGRQELERLYGLLAPRPSRSARPRPRPRAGGRRPCTARPSRCGRPW
jgi:ParB family chromosome partitioning protein